MEQLRHQKATSKGIGWARDVPSHGVWSLPSSGDQGDVAVLLDAIGTCQFADVFGAHLERTLRGVRFAALALRADGIAPIISSNAGAWGWPWNSLHDLRHRVMSHHSWGAKVESIAPRTILVHARREALGYAIGIEGDSDCELTEAPLGRLACQANLLIGVIVKHSQFSAAQTSASSALSALPEIEKCLAHCGRLTTRESEVCARILYGLSTLGISLDLDVGEGTVKTYRKRAYRRLAIGSERELVAWYLGQWAVWKGMTPRQATAPGNRARHRQEWRNESTESPNNACLLTSNL